MEMSFNAVAKVLFFGCFLAFVELKPVTLDPSAEPIILLRLKRSPNRAFTFSGFNPSTGLSAFATSADFFPSYYRYVPSPPSPPSPSSNYAVEGHEDPSPPSYLPSGESDSSYNYPPSVEFPSLNEDDRKIPSPPSQNLTPPADNTPVTGYGVNANPIQPPVPPKKPKKKPNRVNPAPNQEEEEDAEENDGKSRSSSSASFNAWFPIVLGSYPSRQGPESYKEDVSSPLKEKPGSTVIANSVSNGRSGVASSHAVLYGGESPVQNYRRG